MQALEQRITFPWMEQALRELDEIFAIIEHGRTGLNTGFKRLNNALCGLQPGFHIIAGEANFGKSLFANQLAWQVANNNEKVHVIDITLDDTKFEKLCRLIAHITGIPINVVKVAGLHKEKNPSIYKNTTAAFQVIKKNIEKYEIVDGAQAGTIGALTEFIRHRVVDYRSLEEPWQVVVFIDSFHDLIPDVKVTSDTAKYDYLAQAISDLANELDIPIVCTAELRKLNGQRRPVPDDIRESIKIRYEAKSILLCYNDVGAKGEQADVYWYPPNDVAKYPVFEVHVAKNKYNSFKGRICFEFMPDIAFFKEPDDATHRRYLDAINESIR